MRVLLGLAALAATVSGQATFTYQGTAPGATPTAGGTATSPTIAINVYQTDNSGNPGANAQWASNGVGATLNSGSQQTSNNYVIAVPFVSTYAYFTFITNAYVAQLQYSASTTTPPVYTCDPCATSNCVASPPANQNCASMTRIVKFGPLTGSTGVYSLTDISTGKGTPITNPLLVKVFDTATSQSSYLFNVFKLAVAVVGDPQINGMQGQDFQVHGVPDEIFNMITYPNLQVNARFVYLSSGACHDNFTACFAHPGTYISEEGIRVGKDKIRVVAGSYKHGLSVSVNGVKVTEKKTPLKLGSVELQSHRRVVIKTPIMSIGISNSDKFLNQDTVLYDEKLLALGAERTVLGAGETFHSEVPLHGLQGQTWRNVEYPSGLEYEGSISDYQVVSGNLFGSDFVFNQYKQ